MEEQFGIQRFGDLSERGPLEEQAAQLGIGSANLVIGWLWVEYLRHLDVPGFNADSLVRELQTLDALQAN
jgi:hypothetical protein